MRVFITGGTGFIGSHLVRSLLAAGHETTALSRSLPPFPGAVPVWGDLREPDSYAEALDGQDALIHAALIWGDDPAEDSRATSELFRRARLADIGRMLYVSSTAVHRPFQARMDEASVLRPSDDYGALKAENERALELESQHGNWLVVRAGPTVGGAAYFGAPVKFQRMFTDMAKLALAGEVISVPARDGRQLIGAPDLTQIIVSTISRPWPSGPVIALARRVTPWEEVARQIVSAFGSSSKIEVTEGPGFVPEFDTAKLRRLTGQGFITAEAVREHIAALILSLDKGLTSE